MGKGGFAPQPAAIKRLRGNPGKRKIEDPPEPDQDNIEPPASMSFRARKVWDRYVPELKKLGLMSNMDVDAFGSFCQAVSDYWQAVEKINEFGMISQAKGLLRLSPYMRAREQAHTEMVRLGQRFGFSPSDRNSLQKATIETMEDLEIMRIIS